MTFEDKPDHSENAKPADKPYWRDDHLTVPDGPGWVFSTKDGAGWKQDVFKATLANAIKSKEGDKTKRDRTDTDDSQNGRDGNTRPRRYQSVHSTAQTRTHKAARPGGAGRVVSSRRTTSEQRRLHPGQAATP